MRCLRLRALAAAVATLLLLAARPARSAYDLDVNSAGQSGSRPGGGPATGVPPSVLTSVGHTDSIDETARQMTEDMMTMYHGDEPGQIPGLLPDPYYCGCPARAVVGSPSSGPC